MSLKRFQHGISERATRATKKPKCCSQDHSFSPINNPGTVLEILAVPEYFGTTFIHLLIKIKTSGFWWAVLIGELENQYFLFSQKEDKNYTEILRNC